MAFQKFGHVCCGSSEEADSHTISPFGFLGPLDFVAVIDKGTEDKRDISVDYLFSCHANVVPRIRENGR